MRYLAGSAINFSVWMPEPSATNIFVRAPPQATVARLQQYVHWQLSQRSETELAPVEEFRLELNNQELDLDTTLQNVDPNFRGVIRLRLEHRGARASDTPVHLRYYGDLDFGQTNVEFQLNVLSTDKILSEVQQEVPLNFSLAKLKKIAIEFLNRYESQNGRNMCSVKEHTVQDLIGFDIMGRLHPTHLTTDDSNNDLRLYDLLGFDFPPERLGSCCLMFRTRHDQALSDGIPVKFISDATLTMNQMKVSTETTVLEMKEFICTVYGHALRLIPADVKLIYKGQLLHDTNTTGQHLRVLDYISEIEGANVHVYINQEYTEPGPGFWSELFNSPERFTFMSRSASESVDSNTRGNTAAQQQSGREGRAASVPNLPRASALNAETHGNTGHAVENSHVPVQYEFLTESGSRIERTGERFEKVIISGQERFIRPNEFESKVTVIDIAGAHVELLSEEVSISQGAISLSPNAVRRIEAESGLTLAYFPNVSANATPTPTTGDQLQENVLPTQAVIVQETRRMARIRQWTEVIMRTVYLFLRNSIFYFLIFFQVTSFLSSFYSALGILLIIIKTLWSTTEIWDLWRDLLWHGQAERIGEEELAKLRVILHDRKLPKEFYSRFADNRVVGDALFERLREDLDLREKLKHEYKMEHSLQLSLPQLLERCTLAQFDQVSPESLHEMFEPVVREVSEHLEDIGALSAPGKEVLQELRKYVYHRSQLPWYKSAVRWIKNKSNAIYNGGLVNWLMPERVPRARRGFGLRLALHIIRDLFKLICLFFVIVVPKFQTQAVEAANRAPADHEHQD